VEPEVDEIFSWSQMEEPSRKVSNMLNTSSRNGFKTESNHVKRAIHAVTTQIGKIRNTALITIGDGIHLLAPFEK
jgi:hypothetical protein